MRMSFWQFLGLLAIVAIIWYLIYYWGASQDGQSWIAKMNHFFFSSDEDADEYVERKQGDPNEPIAGAEGWTR
ncbi:hypothetical protein JW859_13625 [bacterium]|nr:hypothetical protein [bacterium]